MHLGFDMLSNCIFKTVKDLFWSREMLSGCTTFQLWRQFLGKSD